jgi:hypothetical protein
MQRSSFLVEVAKQNLIAFYHIALSNNRKEKGGFPSICEEAEGVLETADLDLVGMAPHEEVRKGKFRNGRRELGKEGIEEGFVFED